MERFDVNEGARLAEMVEAARAGEEVVITRAGEVIATLQAVTAPRDGDANASPMPAFLRELRAFHREFPELTGGDAATEVWRMREEGVERLLRR